MGRFVLVVLAVGNLVGAAADDAGVAWDNRILGVTEPWSDRMNEARVRAGAAGLCVETSTGRTWAIAAVPRLRVPPGTLAVEIEVAALASGSRWLSRFHGPFGTGTGALRTVSLFEGMPAGVHRVAIDPRIARSLSRVPVQFQLGLEGAEGGSAVFASVRFIQGSASGGDSCAAFPQPGQITLDAVSHMPEIPNRFLVPDWHRIAASYDRFVFDLAARGQFLPLTWLDESRVNKAHTGFGMCSYAGDRDSPGGPDHESVTSMGALLGATVAGIDKSAQSHDWIGMIDQYHNTANGQGLVLNRVDTRAGQTFWYELWPHVVFYALADRYPDQAQLWPIVRSTAESWCRAVERLRPGPGLVPEFDWTAYDFVSGRGVDNGRWTEPDGAAGIAWLAYAAHRRFGDPAFLEAADACIASLCGMNSNPYYEILLPYGALVAARLNAEWGRGYNVVRLVEWCFGLSDCRGGWGVILNRWGERDCHGLLGSVDNRGGYAFAMNTFAQAGALVPLVRYDSRFAASIGKWMVNAASAARYFYPAYLPADHQSCSWWEEDEEGVIAYEGLRCEWEGKSPYATGDPVVLGWGPKTNRGLYGSGYVGLFGGIIGRSEHDAILVLDCLATDFFASPAYPTYLVYNPYPESRTVRLPHDGTGAVRVYDAVSHRFVGEVGLEPVVELGPRHAAVAVLCPGDGRVERAERLLSVNGVTVDFAAP
jgi:hypothetical protein